MRSTVLLAAGLLAGCGFAPSGLITPIDGAADDDVDAPAIDAPGDGRDPIDAAIDAPVIDAAADAAIDAAVPMCPAGYVALGTSTSRYRVVETGASWTTAAADCDGDDDGATYSGFTHLIVVGSELERLAITVPPTFSGNTWLGLTDAVTEGLWVWVTDEPTGGYPGTSTPPWATAPAQDLGKNCARFKNDFLYDDRDCGEDNSYVCECDGFPPR